MSTKTISDNRFHLWGGKPYVRCTHILDIAYPKDQYFYEWLKEKGQEAEGIKTEAARMGTAIHGGIYQLLTGESLYVDSYKESEWERLAIFVDWWKETKPEVIKLEQPVFHKKLKVTGTFDALLKIHGETVLVDWKSSKTMQDHFHLQTAFYLHAWESMGHPKVHKTAVLRLGTKHKLGYEWTERTRAEIKTDFELFKACKKIFDSKVGKDFAPKNKEVPLILKI